MKKGINILRLLLITAVIFIAIAVGLAQNRVDYSELTEVTITHSGTMALVGDEYTLSLENGTWIASHTQRERLESTTHETAVDDAFVNDIKKILKENKAHKWNTFNIKYEIKKKMAPIMTDGIEYSFYMHFSDDTVVEINEYNICPDGFITVLKEFEKQFEMLNDK